MRGGDRCRFELAQALAKDGRADYCLLGYDHLAQVVDNPRQIPMIETSIRPNQHPQAEVFENLWLPLLARRHGIDIYHGTFNVLPLLPAAKSDVVTLHDMAVFDFPEAYGQKFGIYMRQLIRRAIASASAIIAVSKATAQKIVERFPQAAARITVIPNGVGQEFLDAGERSPEAERAAIAHLAPEPYVLFVGNLEPKKNLVRLIEAFLRFKARHQLTHQLVIVGEELPNGPRSGLSEHLIKEAQEHVRFLGYLPDALLPAIYRAADLIAYPSTYEGFGMPVLEGLAAGVPVLTANISSLPEVGGGHACLVDPYDVEAMSSAIFRCLTDLDWRQKASVGGLKHARSLSWGANASATEELYFELFKRQKKAR